MTTIVLAGVTFNTGRVPDADGCTWSMRVPKGWDARPQQFDIGESTARAGGYVLANRARPRTLVARGLVRAPSETAAWRAYQRVISAMPGYGPDRAAELVVDEPIPKWLTVQQTGVSAEEPRGIIRLVPFELELVAINPFKRAIAPRTYQLGPGSTVSVSNAGNEAAYVDVKTTTAGTVKLRQNASGAVMRTRISVGSGTVFDAAARTVRSAAGLDIYDAMASPSEWLSIPRESTVTLTNQGTAALAVTFYDTYA